MGGAEARALRERPAVGIQSSHLVQPARRRVVGLAATHPERTSALALVNVSPRFRHAEGYEEGIANEIVDQALEGASIPGSVGYLELTAPSLAQDERAQRWFARAGGWH